MGAEKSLLLQAGRKSVSISVSGRMTPGDQIDPFAAEVISCRKSRTQQIAESFNWHLRRLPEKQDRRAVILKLGEMICLECGSEELPCYCRADD